MNTSVKLFLYFSKTKVKFKVGVWGDDLLRSEVVCREEPEPKVDRLCN